MPIRSRACHAWPNHLPSDSPVTGHPSVRTAHGGAIVWWWWQTLPRCSARVLTGIGTSDFSMGPFTCSPRSCKYKRKQCHSFVHILRNYRFSHRYSFLLEKPFGHLKFFLHAWFVHFIYETTSTGFPGVAATPNVHMESYFFLENCMKMKEIEPRGAFLATPMVWLSYLIHSDERCVSRHDVGRSAQHDDQILRRHLPEHSVVHFGSFWKIYNNNINKNALQ